MASSRSASSWGTLLTAILPGLACIPLVIEPWGAVATGRNVSQGTDRLAFAQPQYWDSRYTQEGAEAEKDWYFSWNDSGAQGGLRGLLDRTGVTREARILHVGCGNSGVPQAMWTDGFHTVTHLDLSEVVIRQLSARLDFTGHRFVAGDMTNTSFSDGAFDAVLDKGALDAVWNGGQELVHAAVQEISRLLVNGGYYIMVSHAPFAERLPVLENASSQPVKEGSTRSFQCNLDEICKEPRADGWQICQHIYMCRKSSLPVPNAEL